MFIVGEYEYSCGVVGLSPRPARNIGGISCLGLFMSCLGGCIGHMLFAMSWHSWIIVVPCAAAKFIWAVFA